jgi:hypothetical protein
MANAHSAFADEWLHCLNELRQGGWDDSSTDLRQAYIKALQPSPTLYNAAICYATESHDLLISYLRSWTQLMSSRQESDVQRKEQLKRLLLEKGADVAGADTAGATPKSVVPASPQKRPDAKGAAALRSEVKALQTQLKQLQQTQQRNTPSEPALPKGEFFCNGCGYSYNRTGPYAGKRVPCEDTCVFEEHEEHNAGYKSGVAWPAGKRRLFWGSPAEYQKKYGKEMPERGKIYLELRKSNMAKRNDTPGKP